MLRKEIVHSGTSTPDANRLFNEMLQLTITLFNLSSTEALCSKGAKKRWEDLANIWKSYADEACEYSVFDLALHKIYWGVYPEPMKEAYIPLVRLVEDELISDGPAFNVWRTHSSYRFAFSYMKDQEKALVYRGPRPHSYIFWNYQNSRFWFNVVYKRRKPDLINPAASLHDMKAAKIHESIYAACEGFEKAINCLIPDSKNWTDQQWLDDLNIHRGLKKLYNIQYCDNDPDFEFLIAALINKFHYNTPIHLAQLLEVGSIPMDMIQKIWPIETDTELKKLFLQAASRAKTAETRIRNCTSRRYGLYSYKKLQNSWLYKYVYNAVTCTVSHNKFDLKVKRKVFEVGAYI